jgi:hypothetical protein
MGAQALLNSMANGRFGPLSISMMIGPLPDSSRPLARFAIWSGCRRC